MRRLAAAVLTMILLLLCSCAAQEGDEQAALSLRSALAGAAGCEFTSAVHADCDGRRYDFSLHYTSTSEEDRITVLEPEEVAGVSATVDETGADLVFEDLVLDLGLGEEAITSPLMQPQLMCACIESAYIAYTADAGDGTAVRYYYGYGDDRLEVQVVLDRASLVPLTCEVIQDGKVILSAEITDFELIPNT